MQKCKHKSNRHKWGRIKCFGGEVGKTPPLLSQKGSELIY